MFLTVYLLFYHLIQRHISKMYKDDTNNTAFIFLESTLCPHHGTKSVVRCFLYYHSDWTSTGLYQSPRLVLSIYIIPSEYQYIIHLILVEWSIVFVTCKTPYKPNLAVRPSTDFRLGITSWFITPSLLLSRIPPKNCQKSSTSKSHPTQKISKLLYTESMTT